MCFFGVFLWICCTSKKYEMRAVRLFLKFKRLKMGAGVGGIHQEIRVPARLVRPGSGVRGEVMCSSWSNASSAVLPRVFLPASNKRSHLP